MKVELQATKPERKTVKVEGASFLGEKDYFRFFANHNGSRVYTEMNPSEGVCYVVDSPPRIECVSCALRNAGAIDNDLPGEVSSLLKKQLPLTE